MGHINKPRTGGSRSRRVLWLLLAVAVIWFGNIEYRKLVKSDEGRYAEIPREMVASGDWVTPRLNDLKYFEKPPLQYWATATAYTVFGEHQWTARLWPALTGFAGVLLVWFAGVRLFGREAGLYAGLLLGSSLLYVLMAHFNSLDMGVTFFLTLGIVGLLLGQKGTGRLDGRREQAEMQGAAQRATRHTNEVGEEQASTQHSRSAAQQGIKASRNWMCLAWVALGLAILSKGFMGIVLPGVALFIYSVLQRDIGVWKRMHWGIGMALLLLVTVPWFYLVIKANPEFFQRFFIYEHYTRFTTKEHGRYQPWHYFIPVLLMGMLPWTLLMFDTLLRTWKSATRTDKAFNPERFLLVWVVFIYAFFTLSGSKLASYLLPMFPALALLMGKQLMTMNARRLFWLVAPVLPLALLGLELAPFAARIADTPLQAQLYGEYAVWLVAAALVCVAGVSTALFMLHKRRKLVAVFTLASSCLLAAQIGTSGYNTIAPERSAYYIADAIRPYVKAEMPFYSIATYAQTLPFYLKHTFILVAYQDEMAFGIMQEPERWIPDIAGFAKAWQGQKEALAIMPVEIYPQLQSEGVAMKTIYTDSQYVVIAKP